MRRLVMPLASLTALALLTAGCSAFADDDGATGSDGGRIDVVAAFYPLQYAAQRVGGDRVSVENLTQLGKEPHDLEPTVRETAEISAADLVLHEDGFQAAVDDAIAENATGTVLDAAEFADLVPFEDHEAGEDHAHAEDEHEGEDHAHEGDDEHGDEDSHDHGELDPHFWLDPVRMADVADAIADDLAEIDPDHAEEYAANAADLRSELEDLDATYADTLASCERDTIVVSHDAFGYLDKYGLEVAGVAGLSPDAEPTPAGLARLQELIDTDGITTVFGERLASPALTSSLASDTGTTTEVLDPIEGLTDDTADEDYLSIMTSNLAALEKANGCR